MEEHIHYAAGEEVVLDYTDTERREIWGVVFEFGDAIVVRLRHDVTNRDLSQAMRGAEGPWGWGAFATSFVEGIAEEVGWLYDDAVLYRAPQPAMQQVLSRPVAAN
ncbi:MAG: hypothetical protein ACR2GR_10945 [Rhodothermales bacterium]